MTGEPRTNGHDRDGPQTATAAERLNERETETLRPDVGPTPWVRQHDPRFDAICERVRSHGDGLRVLDVGAAPYHLTERLLGLDAVASVDGLNRGTSDDRGHEDRVRLPNGTATVRYCNAEADAWPVEGSSYDVVVMGAILEHLFHPAFALHQARMAVREQTGRLVLSTPNGLRLKQRVETALGLDTPHDDLAIRDGGAALYDRHQHEYSRGELRDLLTKTGWHTHPDDVQSLQLARNGLAGRLYRRAAALRQTWGDQWIVDAHAGTQWVGRPDVYRQGVTDRHE